MDRREWNVAIVGITGAVGRTMLECISHASIPVASLRGFASERSEGVCLSAAGLGKPEIKVEKLAFDRLLGSDLVLVSAGAEVSRRIVKPLAAEGIWVVDNSSAFRLDPDVPLIVPEVNPVRLPRSRGAVANPNCSTIQMVVAIAPLAESFGIRRVHVATYQSVSGSGRKGIDRLRAEREGVDDSPALYPHPIDRNVIPQCDIFLADGFTREEEKMIRETRKILEIEDLAVHPTCVRVPVEIGHGEAIHVELEKEVTRESLLDLLRKAPGVRIDDDPDNERYPTPLSVAGHNEVFIGRIRVDRTDPRIVELWVVADNLRKGAATNAVQIAERLYAGEL